MQEDYLEKYLIPSVERLYSDDGLLFDHDLSERCIVFRLAHYLQCVIDADGQKDVYVDCDYNSHVVQDEDGEWRRKHGKPLRDRSEDAEAGSFTGRFIDIIVHKRSENQNEENWSDLFCIEVKKWNNQSAGRNDKDRNNLERLTSDFGYEAGFHLVLGKAKENTTIEVFSNGSSIGDILKTF
jgi:hypothetical protein